MRALGTGITNLLVRKRGVYSTDDVSDTTHYKASDSSKIGKCIYGETIKHLYIKCHGRSRIVASSWTEQNVG